MDVKEKIRFLHIAYNRHKFMGAVTSFFDGDERIENRYLFLDEEGPETIKGGDYDVAYFHSLPDRSWRLLKFVPENKTIIWWAWGYDIYESFYGLSPFISIRYLQITKQWMRNAFGITFKLKKPLKWIYGHLFVERYRKEVLHRTDYFQPVLTDEWNMMQERYKDFHARLFLVPYSHPTLRSSQPPLGEKETLKPVMLGNSGLFGGNLPDVIEKLDHAGIQNREFIVPLSYGQSQQYMDKAKQRLKASSLNYRILDQFLPLEEYQKIMVSCRFMVNGILRQGAVGNISFALQNGVKVFLWRDSMLYQYYQKIGVKVFAIDDINSHSFDEPLSEEDSLHNLDLMKKNHEYMKNVYNQVINELLLIINNKTK